MTRRRSEIVRAGEAAIASIQNLQRSTTLGDLYEYADDVECDVQALIDLVNAIESADEEEEV